MRRRLTVAVCIASFLAVTGFATSAIGGPIRQAQRNYRACRHHVRPRACGRDIISRGWKERDKPARPATKRQIVLWSARLHRLAYPPRFLSAHGKPPRVPLGTGALTATYNPTGLAACIVHKESRGNPQAVNGQYRGLAQWSPEAWARMGGHRYAATPTGATEDQQLIVLSNGLQHYGCRDWCPYDGC